MACCGRGRRRNNPRPVPASKIPSTRPIKVGINRCVHCGGELKANPNPIKLGAQMVVKCKCLKCGKQMYRIQR